MLLAASFLESPRKIVVVSSNHDKCLRWQAKLTVCGIPEHQIRQLPSGTSALFEDASPEHVALSERIGAIRALVEPEPCIVLTTPQAALERTLPKEILEHAFLGLSQGVHIEPEALAGRLRRMGYEYQEPVRLPGHYSRRGGIVDVFAMGRDLPVRIELFGDEIESLRQFDPVAQRSVGPIPSFSLAPSRETLYPADVADFTAMLEHAVETEVGRLDNIDADRLRELIEGDIEALGRREYFDRLDLYRPLIHPDSACALDLLGQTGQLVLEEPVELDSVAARAFEELGQALESRFKRGEMLHSYPGDFMFAPDHLGTHDSLAFSMLNAFPDWLPAGDSAELGATSLEPYRGRPETLALTLKNWADQGFEVVFCTDQPNRAKTVLKGVDIFPAEALPPLRSASDIETSIDLPPPSFGKRNGGGGRGGEVRPKEAEDPGVPLPEPPNPRTSEPPNAFFLAQGNLAGGFFLTAHGLAFVTDAELFGVGRLRLPQKRFLEGAPIATLLDLKPGDFVVHIQFGIGRYQGLVKKTVDGIEREFLFIEYAYPDKLFVPADQLDRVQKYLNPGDAEPKVNRLHGNEWQKTISKARDDAKLLAQDLVKLYAERKVVKRRPFGPDTPWQAEMEATFPWVETPSQLQAVRDVKRDMAEDFPMDRLVCGDVGFGKTEIAIRGAFKSVQDGKQVAVLCPTTILSEQHFRNFHERMSSFGVRLALLNRFRHAAERARTLADLETGKVDLVIGTHALLSSEVRFKELGLLIVDEEQKFGVKQKEGLKKLRVQVDVLAMSATPIPRTLSMALMDLRQMSLINDPPPGRLPIRTFLRPYSQEVVREAILRELGRGGQVFYVYNRVQGIQHVAEKLRKLVPTARIGVGHGQMSESELEPVMIAFIEGELDVLLSTTIVESGLDIPNVNTLIVENADRFGLSQLYQLRGRVGRSDRQAYAYFLYQHGRELTEGAMSRLQALQEFTALGSGYSLAFRDLQIRGAGELLGAKQHGAMASVGYELFTQLIHEAVALQRAIADAPTGERASSVTVDDVLAESEPLPALELPVTAMIPDSYIKDEAQRLYYYQRIMSARDRHRLGEVEVEVEDRYGHPPEPVRTAFAIMQLRVRMRESGMSKADGKGGRLSVAFKHRASVPPMAFSLLGKRNRECYLSRDALVWPFTGDSLRAMECLMDEFEACLREVEQARVGD